MICKHMVNLPLRLGQHWRKDMIRGRKMRK